MERSAIVLSTGLLFLAGMAGQSTQSVGMARQVGPDARRLQTGTFMYRDLDHDKDVGKTEIVIRELRGSGNFCFSANITGKFSQNWQSIATSRFEPISAKLSFGEGTSIVPAFDLKYSSGKVAGFAFPRNAPATKRPVDASVPAGTVDQRIDWAAVLASDLETGREFEFNAYDPGTGVSRVVARVGSIERVRVPAGSFEAYRIVYRIEKTGGAETYQVLASVRHVMVREEFPDGMVSELTGIGAVD